MITSTQTLSSFISVAPRFSRSVHLEKDFQQAGALTGYVLTSAARSALKRIVASLKPQAAQRAWSLTGPYGSGKSAFALFLAQLLDNHNEGRNQAAQVLLRQEDTSFFRTLFDKRHKGALDARGLCPVLISGTREPLALALVRALEEAVRNYWWSEELPPIHQRLTSVLTAAKTGSLPSSREVADLYVAASRDPACGAGLLVMIDELGRYLEYSASSPNGTDLGVLQDVAEVANRSGDHPILLVTMLHQSFERYAARLTPLERDEWSKVQGRFEDVIFHDSPEQVLRLIASALVANGDEDELDEIAQHAAAVATQAASLGLCPLALEADEFLTLSSECYPLHPTVALQLGTIFRKLAQNERSLFAFLGAHEPFGLRDFLESESWKGAGATYYRIDHLYDYLVSSLGPALFAGLGGRRWAEVEQALERAVGVHALALRLIKCIGLQHAVGVRGNLKPSRDFLRFALVDGHSVTIADVDEALQSLVTRSTIVYRNHTGAYGLWEGSDIDLEARLAEAFTHIDAGESLVRLLDHHSPPRPIVARRHSFTTGTMRFFEVRYVDMSNLDVNYHTPSVDGDGLILCVLANSDSEARHLEKRATSEALSAKDTVLIALPKSHAILHDAARELAALRWISSNTPELASDLTARKELQARIVEVSQWLESRLQALFDDDRDGHATCSWYHAGSQLPISDSRSLNRFLSQIFDSVYNRSPRVLNELINRRHLSSAAASARRLLLEAMLNAADMPQLGISGYPPEMSMYRSVLESSGVHRDMQGVWGLHRPEAESRARLAPLWEAMDEFFDDTARHTRTAAELFAILQRPPYGVKAGLLPVFLVAYLMNKDADVAIYEQNSFVPRLTTAVLERLIKAASDFTFHKSSLSGAREAVYDSMLRVLNETIGAKTCERNLLNLVRPLCRLVDQLPGHARKSRRLTDATLALREAVITAREPDKLLFESIPTLFGLPSISPDIELSPEMMLSLEKGLRTSLQELTDAYPRLLDHIVTQLRSQLQFTDMSQESRQIVAAEAMTLMPRCVEPKLKGLLIRLADEDTRQQEWLESLGDHLAQKPPEVWTDEDLTRFEAALAEVSRSYLHLKALWFEVLPVQDTTSDAFRVGITRLGKREHEKVVTVDHNQAEAVASLVERLRDAMVGNPNVSLAALVQLTGELLDHADR